MGTFLAVVVLLFSSSYVFSTLSKQFALTVGLGVLHGLVLLPVLLALLGPKPYESAENLEDDDDDSNGKLADTAHVVGESDSSSNEEPSQITSSPRNVESD